MDKNPYSAPQTGVSTPTWDYLDLSPSAIAEVRQIAFLQKGIISFIGIYIVLLISTQLVPAQYRFVIEVVYCVAAIAAMICTWLLAITLYGFAMGFLAGLGTGIPCIGILVLAQVNGKATEELKAYGVPVGLFGVPWRETPK